MFEEGSTRGAPMTLCARAKPAPRPFARRSVSSPHVTVPEAPARRPAIVVVDDEPTVLRAVRRDVDDRLPGCILLGIPGVGLRLVVDEEVVRVRPRGDARKLKRP